MLLSIETVVYYVSVNILTYCIIILTMTITGFVLIFFARAAYLNVLIVSLAFDLAGETHAIC